MLAFHNSSQVCSLLTECSQLFLLMTSQARYYFRLNEIHAKLWSFMVLEGCLPAFDYFCCDKMILYIFSLGVIMWKLCTLKRPWDGVAPERVVYAVANEGSRLDIPEGPLGRLIISRRNHMNV
ncbi:hypothetical protein Droror1_Dr00021564 [Drosera rotundifolia]